MNTRLTPTPLFRLIKPFFGILIMLLGLTVANAYERITVGYFNEWPTPNLLDQEVKRFQELAGIPLVWRAFETSEEMAAALDQGDIQIAYGLEIVPTIKAIQSGSTLQITGIAISYAGYNQCVVGRKSYREVAMVEQLRGAKIAVQRGSLSHFRMRQSLAYLGLTEDDVEIVPAKHGTEVSKLIYRSRVTAGCAYGIPLIRMMEHGQPLLEKDRLESAGLQLFDVIAMSAELVESEPQLGRAFLEMTESFNAQYAQYPGSMHAVIGEIAGMGFASVSIFLSYFSFPSSEAQLSPQWLGQQGRVGQTLSKLTAFLAEHGRLDSQIPDYQAFINTTLLPGQPSG